MPPLSRSALPTWAGGVSPEGYIANLLLSGRIPDLKTLALSAPTSSQAQHVCSTWDRLLAENSSELLWFLRVRGRVALNDGEMRAVLRNLSVHTQEISQYLGKGETPSSLRGLIPDLDPQISCLLANPPWTPFHPTDAKVLAMVRWFKSDFMSWVDPIKCPSCKGETTSAGGVEPNSQEREDGAGRVELHVCLDPACGEERRFGRYGKVKALIRTREGRCGEFAHLFYAFLRVAGLEARFVWNSEDHVWAEYWSPALEHWVHVDPSEAVSNKPLLYARGWGKKQAFCIAIGPAGMEDVTRVYVDDWGACRARRRAKRWTEHSLRHAIVEQTVALRLRMPASEQARLEAMDRKQAAWVGDEPRRLKEAEREEVGGRTSGTVDWRAKRQELGLQKVVRPDFTVVKCLRDGLEDMQLFGDTNLHKHGLVLTSGTSQTSAAFAKSSIKQDQSFRCMVTFRITAPPGSGEADGMAVVFSSEKKLGLGGYGLGYSGLGGKGDFAVEIDTYRTQDFADDPPTPHISVHSPPNAHHRHSIECTPVDAIPWLSDGGVHTLELLYHGGQRRLWGFLGLPENPAEANGEEMALFDVRIPDGGRGQWYVGVTGSCGGLWQKQEVLSWTIEEIYLNAANMPNTESL